MSKQNRMKNKEHETKLKSMEYNIDFMPHRTKLKVDGNRSFLSRNSHPLHTKTYATKQLLEIPLWIFLRSLITLLATKKFFQIFKNRVEVNVKVKALIFYILPQHTNMAALKLCCPDRVSKKLKNDTKITFLAMIRAEIQATRGTRSSWSGQTFMTRISESTWPKFLKNRVFTYLIGYNKGTKFRENPSRSCQFSL